MTKELDLDQEVAKALGWKLVNYETDKEAKTPADFTRASANDGWTWEGRGIDEEAWEWRPSQEADCAVEAIEALRAKNSGIKITVDIMSNPAGKWSCALLWGEPGKSNAISSGFVDELPMAITVAVLKAHGVQVPS